jgi:hypothetical protein
MLTDDLAEADEELEEADEVTVEEVSVRDAGPLVLGVTKPWPRSLCSSFAPNEP